MRIARLLFVSHVVALVFGLAGLLIAIPHPELWADEPRAFDIYNFGMKYAGSLHIVFGALAMFAFGVVALGWRKTSIFFACSVPISLASELIGTGTGWPFGNYAYTNFLGYKVLDHVPFSIPLSWFYVGFSSYLIGAAIAQGRGLRPRWAWSLGLGAWFLTVWDLVLDPAMAHESLAVKFWVWDETGPYFGMPVQNFVGWSATALIFMGLARFLWREEADTTRMAVWFPLGIYATNTIFAMALSASVDLWVPILLAAVLGLAPAGLAWRGRGVGPARTGGESQEPTGRQWRVAPSR